MPQLQYNPFLNASVQPSLGNTISMPPQPIGGLEIAKAKQKKTSDSLQVQPESTSRV